MYTGNGVTRKFPLPDGYDGSEVYLIFPTGKSIKMLKDEGYTVSEGAVCFFAAIPAGVVVSFDKPEEVSEAGEALSYVVIYKDGRIVEVTEDPAEYLAQSQKVLVEARKHFAEVTEYAGQTISQMMALKESLTDDYERTLYEYTLRGKALITENAEVLKGEIRTELEGALLRINKEAQTIEAGLQIMELTKTEIQAIAKTAAGEVRQEVLSKCEEALKARDDIEHLKEECKYYYEEAKAASQKAGMEAQASMNLKVEEELEMLKSLRLKLETDSEAINERLNNAWKILRGEKE